MSNEIDTQGRSLDVLPIPPARRSVQNDSVQRAPGQYQARRPAAWVFWLYLLIIASIEAMTVLSYLQLGLLLYACLLIAFTLHSGLGDSDESRKLALALALVPLARMIALSLPLIELPQAAWYPAVALPMLVAAWVVMHQAALPFQIIGAHRRNRIFHLMMISGGLGLGALAYAVFQPRAILAPFAVEPPLVLALVVGMVFLAGFTEEIIFRGLVQKLSGPLMGRWSLLYSALVFAVLHIGYLSVWAVVFALLIGLLFAQIVHWSGSVLGVALVHGMASVTQLLLMPYLIRSVSGSYAAVPWLVALGMTSTNLVILFLVLMFFSLSLVLIVLGYLCALP